MEKLWLLLFCVAVVGYFSYRDNRRIKLHDGRKATGHCALCANKLEQWFEDAPETAAYEKSTS